MNNKKYYLAALLSFTIWGFFSLPLKMMSGYAPGEILFFRVVFAVALLLGYFLLIRRDVVHESYRIYRECTPVQKRNLAFLTVGGGILLVANWLLFIYVVNEVNIKTATFSYFICPILTAVLGFVILKESLTIPQWIAVAICTISCVLIGKDSVSELAYSLVIAFCYAFYLITQRKNIYFDRLFVLAIQLISVLILILPFYNKLVITTPDQPSFYFAVMMISLFFTVIPLFLNLYALKKLNTATLGILMYINPMINFSLGVLYFGEEVSNNQMIGYLLIALALVIFNYQNMKKLGQKISNKISTEGELGINIQDKNR